MHGQVLEALYRTHSRAALLYILACCGDLPLAEDIVAQAFEKALLTLENDRPEFRWWLLAVCKNLWLDEVRRRKRRGTAGLEDAPLSVPDASLEGLLRQERHAALYRAMGRLPARQRELLTLHYFTGVPLNRAAELMGMGYPAAKTGLCRARQKLRRLLEEDGYEF